MVTQRWVFADLFATVGLRWPAKGCVDLRVCGRKPAKGGVDLRMLDESFENFYVEKTLTSTCEGLRRLAKACESPPSTCEGWRIKIRRSTQVYVGYSVSPL